MSTPPTISVVIPLYNGESTLAETISSVLAQEVPSFEIVIVDDGSTDDSGVLARSFDVRYFHQEHQGVAAARNRGVEEAEGRLIAFLDQDDTWLPAKLGRQAQTLLDDDGLGFAFCYQTLRLAPGLDEPPDWVSKDQLDTPMPGWIPSTLMMRRSVFRNLGGFDEKLCAGSESAWFIKSKEQGVSMVMLSEPLVFRKIHANNAFRIVGSTQGEHLDILAESLRRMHGVE